MHRIFAICAIMIAALLTFSPSRSAAEPMPVVVELFTSQGCSSCPPADALLTALAQEDDVIALALHVDYWDYIGWKDRFARPEFTRRQKGYARAGGWGVIYTPQIVVNGVQDVVGSRRAKVDALIARNRTQQAEVRVTLARESAGSLLIKAEALNGGGPWDIHVVRYNPGAQVRITKGENAGRTIDYSHIAQDWDVAARWSGQEPFEGRVPMIYDGPVVVLVQQPGYGPIVGAARLR